MASDWLERRTWGIMPRIMLFVHFVILHIHAMHVWEWVACVEEGLNLI